MLFFEGRQAEVQSKMEQIWMKEKQTEAKMNGTKRNEEKGWYNPLTQAVFKWAFPDLFFHNFRLSNTVDRV